MFLFDLTNAVTGLMMLAGSSGCIKQPPAYVGVNVTTNQPQYFFDYTTAQIADIRRQKRLEEEKKSGGQISVLHEEEIVAGLMIGEMKFDAKTLFEWLHYRSTDTYCIRYKEITVNIEYSPKIYIAKEFQKDKCERDAVLAHEQEHVLIDHSLLKKNKKRFDKELFRAAMKIGTFGPVTGARKKQAIALMKKNISDKTFDIILDWSHDRLKWQGGIDSQEEYDRLWAICHKHKQGTPQTPAAFMRKLLGR